MRRIDIDIENHCQYHLDSNSALLCTSFGRVNPSEARARVVELAQKVGLPSLGFAPAQPVLRHPDFLRWLDAGYAGEMSYLARDAEARRDPRALLHSARTVVVAALSYAHADGAEASIPPERLREGPRGFIARYARGGDYHHILKRRLQRLGDALELSLGRPVERLVCVDTALLLERALAAESGLGFIAKSAMLIAPGQGSYLSLGALLVDFDCEPGQAEASRCGSCRLCLDACPTGAFVGAHVLDARRCISYLTIENRGPIPRELRSLIGARVFGCDVCQEVCPFNASGPTVSARSTTVGEPELAPRPGYSHPPLLHLLRLGAAQFRKWQLKSSLRRIHRKELLRNVAVALGNVGGKESLSELALTLREPSPLVRAHVVWALGAIAGRIPELGPEVQTILAAHRPGETDPDVLEELKLVAT